jgi:hypothetical protein
MPTTDYQPPVGQAAVLSGQWSWRDVGVLSAARVDPPVHDCPADADMEYQARGLAGELWRCRRCHRPWTKVGNGFYEPCDATLAAQVER